MSIEKLKIAGGTAAGLVLVLALIALPIILLTGAAEFSLWALDWIPDVIGFAFFACVILLPIAIIPPSRGFAANAYAIASFVFGVCLWLYGLAFTYVEWGMLGVIIGVVVFGIGVVFTATLAAIFSGTWVVLGNLAILFGLYIGARLFSSWLSHLAENRSLRKVMRESPSAATITQDI